jgi:hypothetical protein
MNKVGSGKIINGFDVPLVRRSLRHTLCSKGACIVQMSRSMAFCAVLPAGSTLSGSEDRYHWRDCGCPSEGGRTGSAYAATTVYRLQRHEPDRVLSARLHCSERGSVWRRSPSHSAIRTWPHLHARISQSCRLAPLAYFRSKASRFRSKRRPTSEDPPIRGRRS